jgi:hypothetical protein
MCHNARKASPPAEAVPRPPPKFSTPGAQRFDLVEEIEVARLDGKRPVRIIVGFAPAGATDIMARLIGQWLSGRLGQQFVIENRPGAGTNIATEAVVNAPLTAIRYYWLVFQTRVTRRSTKIPSSILSATSRLLQALLATRLS